MAKRWLLCKPSAQFLRDLPALCRPLLPFAVREQLAANIQKAERGEGQTEEGPLAKHVRKAIEEHKEEYRGILKK